MQLFVDSIRPVFPQQEEWTIKPSGLEKAYLRLVFKNFKKIAKEIRIKLKRIGYIRTAIERAIKIPKHIKKQKNEGISGLQIENISTPKRTTGLIQMSAPSKGFILKTPIKIISSAEQMRLAGYTPPQWDDRPD